MNKQIRNDIILLLLFIIVGVTSFLIINFNKESNNLKANIFYDNQLIDVIDLNNNLAEEMNKEYVFDGFSFTVGYKHNKIRVVSADCKRKICVKHGYSQSTVDPIICLDKAFKIILVSDDDYDIVVG